MVTKVAEIFCIVQPCQEVLFRKDNHETLENHIDGKKKQSDGERERPRQQWFRTTKNRDVITGLLARLLACLIAPLTHSLPPNYYLGNI